MNIKEVNKIIGNNIKKYRKGQGITQGDLSKSLKITQQAIANYEKGLNRIAYDKLEHIAVLLGIPLLYFFLDTNNEILVNNINFDHLLKLASDYFEMSEKDLTNYIELNESLKIDLKESLQKVFQNKTIRNQFFGEYGQFQGGFREVKKLMDIYISGNETLITNINNQINLIHSMLKKTNFDKYTEEE